MGLNRRPVVRALLSVSEKEGLEGLARRLSGAGVQLISTGGTSELLAGLGLAVTRVEELIGAPEILDGRVKTLHPAIHAGLLADRERHAHELEALDVEPIDLVVVDLYPFREQPDVETIDIGGVALLRAAAKNHAWVGAVASRERYDEVAEAVEAGGLDDGLRRRLAAEAFSITAAYDAAIAGWLQEDPFPAFRAMTLRRWGSLRYGENPHQEAAAYLAEGREAWWAGALPRQGKALSYNNLLDADAAWGLVQSLSGSAAVIVKHANPCGVAVAASLPEAWDGAWAGDPQSAFGGVVALSETLDAETAARISERFIEVVVAPSTTEQARETLAVRPNLRLLEAPAPRIGAVEVRSVGGGFLLQTPDTDAGEEWKEVAGTLDPELESDLRLAWVVASHARSNAVVLVRDGAAVGVGAGDQSRVGAARRALDRAGDRARGSVAAGDAFFPFRDGLDVLADAGVVAVVAPGGSRRDEEVIRAAQDRGLVLVFASHRHFRH